jgi:hypothetical protein
VPLIALFYFPSYGWIETLRFTVFDLRRAFDLTRVAISPHPRCPRSKEGQRLEVSAVRNIMLAKARKRT